MEYFARIINHWKLITIFTKSSILAVWWNSECAFDVFLFEHYWYLYSLIFIYPLSGSVSLTLLWGGPYVIETITLICRANQLIWRANQWTGFDVIGNSINKELNNFAWKRNENLWDKNIKDVLPKNILSI